MPNVQLVAATSAIDLLKVEKLMQFYLYDFSEWIPLPFDDEGSFFIRPKAEYWAHAGTHAFFIAVDGETAGFATVDTDVVDADTNYSIGYFFVSRRFRGTGTGPKAAQLLVQRFPGSWQIFHVNANAVARAFWQKIVPRLSQGDFSERSQAIDGYECTLYKFRQPEFATTGRPLEDDLPRI
jgi:predicted acetyltransferase